MAKPDSTNIGTLVRYTAFGVGMVCLLGLVAHAVHRLLPVLQVLVPGAIGWWVWQRHCKAANQRQRKLHTTFYRLLQAQHGRITLLDFAMTAKIPAIAARHYLDDRARDFAARFEVTEQGDMLYVFSALQFSRSEPLSASMVLADVSTGEPSLPAALTQAELAKRLGVSAKTVNRKKDLSTLNDWTQTRDPNGVSWSYDAQVQGFFPISDRRSAEPEADRH